MFGYLKHNNKPVNCKNHLNRYPSHKAYYYFELIELAVNFLFGFKIAPLICRKGHKIYLLLKLILP